jgi:hypothetical protein
MTSYRRHCPVATAAPPPRNRDLNTRLLLLDICRAIDRPGFP